MQGLQAFVRYFEFSGRSSRAEYWQAFALVFLAQMIASVVDMGTIMTSLSTGVPSTPILSSLVWVVTVIPMTAATVRRLHDRNKSGWVYGGSIIFLIVTVVCMIVAGAMSEAGNNRLLPVPFAMMASYLLIAVYLCIQLILPGDPFINEYGPPFEPPVRRVIPRYAPQAIVPAMWTPPTARYHGDDSFGRLEQLAEMHRKGLINDEEFSRHKAAVLGGMAR